MRTDEWEQIKLVFEAALELPPESRPSYLESACADPQHGQVVNELLKNHAAAGRFLESQSGRGRYYVFSGEELVASRFRILRQVGYGGMGEVYEAFDERLQVRVALKTLRPELTSDPLALNRFRREIIVAREVSHDSVCKIFDLVEHQEADGVVVPCLTMQLIDGQSLQSFLQTRRPLRPAEALPLIRQIAGAIDALHAHGIVHRDLKPSNIMLAIHNGTMRAVVTDFGLAKPATHPDGGIFESKLDFQAGAPYFMAPELLRDGRPGPASDIYAMGLIIDEMVTETRAFPAESLHSLYYQKLWEAPIPPIARSTRLSPQWNRVILRCLATEIGDRYTCAGDVISDLESADAVPATPAAPTALTAEEQQPLAVVLPRAPSRLASLGWRVLTSLTLLALVAATAILIIRTLAGPGKSSVVVFPIENLTDAAGANRDDLGYLSKGIRAELMRRLTLIDGVQVIPYYETRSKTRIDQLKGRFSLEGLLQASGSRVRLTAQLSDNRNGTLVWSQNFERDLQNPLQLQSDIAEGSVRALQLGTLFGRPVGIRGAGITLPGPLLVLFGFQRANVPRAPTTSSVAFDYYLRGQYLFEERTVPAALDALRSYENALREDPNFALAEAAMADAEFVLMDYEYEPQATSVARARRYVENAIRLDPELAEAYTSLGAVGQAERDFTVAEQSYKRALQLSPRFSRAHRWYSGLLMQFGRRDESLEEMRQAVELDPYDYSAESNQGLFLYYARRYGEAAAKLEDTLAHKDLMSARIHLGRVYCQIALHSSGNEALAAFGRALQQADAVEAAMRRSMTQSPSVSSPRSINYSDRMHAEYYTLSAHPEAARPYLERLISDTAAGRISPISLGTFYAAVGDADRALPLLKDAAVRKDRQLLFIRVMPEFDPIRHDERFQSLLKFMGLQ